MFYVENIVEVYFEYHPTDVYKVEQIDAKNYDTTPALKVIVENHFETVVQ